MYLGWSDYLLVLSRPDRDMEIAPTPCLRSGDCLPGWVIGSTALLLVVAGSAEPSGQLLEHALRPLVQMHQHYEAVKPEVGHLADQRVRVDA